MFLLYDNPSKITVDKSKYNKYLVDFKMNLFDNIEISSIKKYQ